MEALFLQKNIYPGNYFACSLFIIPDSRGFFLHPHTINSSYRSLAAISLSFKHQFITVPPLPHLLPKDLGSVSRHARQEKGKKNPVWPSPPHPPESALILICYATSDSFANGINK